ncbi:Transducin (beta)-like 3, partial [Cladochytrium tenue]
CEQVLDGHVSVVRALEFVSDGQQLISSGRDSVLNVWDVQRGSILMTVPLQELVGFSDEIVDLTFVTPNESMVALASNSEQICVQDLNSSKCDILYGHNGTVLSLAASGDGLLLASGSRDRTGRVCFVPVGLCTGHTESVGAVAFSRKNSNFLVTGSGDRTFKKWDTAQLGKWKAGSGELHLKTAFTVFAHEKEINSVAVAPNDKLIATGSADKTAKLWSSLDGSLVGTCQGHKKGVWSVQFSPVDQVLATASGDKTVRLWSVADYSCLK